MVALSLGPSFSKFSSSANASEVMASNPEPGGISSAAGDGDMVGVNAGPIVGSRVAVAMEQATASNNMEKPAKGVQRKMPQKLNVMK